MKALLGSGSDSGGKGAGEGIGTFGFKQGLRGFHPAGHNGLMYFAGEAGAARSASPFDSRSTWSSVTGFHYSLVAAGLSPRGDRSSPGLTSREKAALFLFPEGPE
jgi:hypothetical protein